MKVFWSWQNDASPARNRHFIRDALSDAVGAIAEDYVLDDAERPELDHDTKNVPGMAEIAGSIRTKVRECAVFVADLTPVARTAEGKGVVNSNVAIELGWAAERPGWERSIAVLNTADGWTVEDLPFDVRHRRALTYALPEACSSAERAKVKKQLARELAAAIRSNLSAHLEDAVSASPIRGVAARADDPSIWETATKTFSHQHSAGHGNVVVVDLADGPRAYIRVIPSGWHGEPATASDIAALRIDEAVWPPMEGWNGGDSGVTAEGHVTYWMTVPSDQYRRESGNVCMYFEDTGEFWILHSTAVVRGDDRSLLRVDALICGWAAALKRANLLLDRFGAYAARKVEVGLERMDGVRWPGSYEIASPPARRGRLNFERQSRDWSVVARRQFMVDAHAKVRNLFGLHRQKSETTYALIDDVDPQL